MAEDGQVKAEEVGYI